jgi:hypothetical protein
MAIDCKSFCALVTQSAQKDLQQSARIAEIFRRFFGRFNDFAQIVVRDREHNRARLGERVSACPAPPHGVPRRMQQNAAWRRNIFSRGGGLKRNTRVGRDFRSWGKSER